MALGCACKLYTLRSIDYRATARQQSRRRRREHVLNRTANTTRRSFSLFNLIRRNNTTTTVPVTTNATTPASTTSNNIYRLVRSASMSSIDYQSLVAPPTYNQTMGLVDEYEQRQLAFIEHVRSMINANNTTTAGTPQNPVVQASSSRSHRRRSHSARHLIRTADTATTPAVAVTNGAAVINLNDPTAQSISRHQRRRHRHRQGHRHEHYHHHHHHHHHDPNRRPSNNQASTTHRPIPLLTQQQQQQDGINQTISNQQQENNVSKVTINLKDRLAKLIKDIVNHGDGIQYVQLAESPRVSPQIEQQPSNIQTIPLETPIEQQARSNEDGNDS
jgi:hypothetical protein